VLKTFPNIEDQLRWVYWGTEGYNAAGVENYGNPDREGGAHLTGASGAVMPAQKDALTGDEILAVVCHERFALSGEEVGDEEFETWCSEESEIFADLEGGGDLLTLADRFPDVLPIGEPVEGSPADE
jgi:hypothetical protein